MSWFRTALTHPQHAFNLARRRIAVTFSHSLSSVINYHAAMPETINIYPTDRCNLKCNMCFQRLRSKHTELSIDAWINILNDISFKPRVHLSGGEPLIYPEFNELIARARAIGSFIAITTNGTLLEEHAKQLVDNKVNSITISIDGDEKTHDQIRGVPGTYQKLLAGLKTMKQVRLDKLVPEIHFNSMINFDQPEMMDSIINLAEH